MAADQNSHQIEAKRVLIINRHAPYATIHAQEAIDVVLAAAAFEQRVTVLFTDQGIWQLKSGQDAGAIGIKNFSRIFAAFEDFEVERICVDGDALTAVGLGRGDLSIGVDLLNTQAVRDLIESSDLVWVF